MSNKEITFCMSVYGNFDILRLKTAVQSVKRQNDVSLEIIIAEEGPEPRFQLLAKMLGVKYYYSCDNPAENVGHNPGKIRNLGLKNANTEYVYLSDADILLRDSKFLTKLIEESNGDVLIKPPMIRIDKRDVLEFMNYVDSNGIDFGIKELKQYNPYVANINSAPVELKVLNSKGRIYTTEMETFVRYRKDDSLKGLEPTFWYDVVHCGGIFARNEQVQKVGLYSEKYLKWGYEDSDLQWKLSEVYPWRFIPEKEEFTVLHLDHDKGYFSKEMNVINGEIFQRRKNAGVVASIQEDINDRK